MRAARLLLGAVIAGAAWLGLGVVLADDNPGPTLGAIAAVMALIGGWAGRTPTLPLALRIGGCLIPLLLARGIAGTAAAALATVCVATGWWLRLRLSDAVVVLAAIGAVVVATSQPSWRLLLAFATLGTLTVVIRPSVAVVRRWAQARAFPGNETAAQPADVTPAAIGDLETPADPSPIADGRPLMSAKGR